MADQGVQKYFFFIKQRVSSDWTDLAYFLGLPDPEIRNIDGRNRDDMSRCMDLLQEWQRRKGNTATIGVLMEALSNAGLLSVLDGLKAKYPELAMRQITLKQPLQETAGQPQSGQPESDLQPVSLGQPLQNTGGQPPQDTTQPKQETTGQPPSEQPSSAQPQQNTREQQPQDTTQPKQETGEQSSPDTSRQPQQETTGPPSSSTSDSPSHPDHEGPKKLFIVHAGEDKASLVEPLAHEIVDQGVPKENIFYDKWSIEHTQSIKESIALAIQDRSCKLAVIVISKDMMKKYWPRKELEEFLKRGIRFFPIFYGVKPEDVRKDYSPTLADTRGVEIPRTGQIVDEILIAGTASKIRKILKNL